MGKQGSPRSPRPETRDKEEKTGRRSLDSLTGNDLLTGRRIFGSEASKAQGSKHDQSCGSINKFNYSWKQQHSWLRRNFKSILVMISVTGLIFFMDSIMVTIFHSDRSSVVQSISRLTNLTDHKVRIKFFFHFSSYFSTVIDYDYYLSMYVNEEWSSRCYTGANV